MRPNARQYASGRGKDSIVQGRGRVTRSPDAGHGRRAPLVDLNVWTGGPVLERAPEQGRQRRGGLGPRRREHGGQCHDAPVRQTDALQRGGFAQQVDNRRPLHVNTPRGKGLEVSGVGLELPLGEVGGGAPIGNERRLMRDAPR